MLGDAVRPSGIGAAPVAPLLTYASFSIAGTFAFVALGAVLSIAPGVGAYAMLRRAVPPWPAAMFAAFLIGVAASGEAASWGGYPQLLGLGLLPPVLLMVEGALRADRVRSALTAGVGLLAIAFTSDFVFVLTAAAAGLLVLMRICFRGPSAVSIKPIAVSLVAMAAPLVLAVPLYARIIATRVAAVTSPPEAFGDVQPGLRSRVDALWFDSRLIWWFLVPVGFAGLLRLRGRTGDPHWRVAGALLVPAVAFVVVFPEPRLAYFVPSAVIIAAGLWSDSVSRRHGLAQLFLGVVACCLVVQLVAMPDTAQRQARRYQALTPGLVAGIEWLREESPRRSVVVVTAYRDAPPLGWWVEGLGRRRTLTASSPKWVHFESEKVAAARAARVLSAGVPTARTLDIARRFGADFVFIDKRWSEFVPARVTALAREVRGVVAFENASVVILRARR